MRINGKTIKILAVICILSVTVSAFSGCGKKVTTAVGDAFGETVSFTFYTPEADAVSEHFNKMMKEIKAAEADFSLSEGSYLSVLNETGVSYVSATLKKDLEDSVIVCTALSDIVDITMGKPLRLWGFDTDSPAVPDSAALKEAVDAQTMDKLVIARESHKVTITDDTEVDMLPVSKGIALDRAYEKGKFCKIPYIATMGDITLAYGEGPKKGGWEISVRDPFSDSEKGIADIRVFTRGHQNNIFVSASGIWENSFSQDGKTYHSYLDPHTGIPCDNGLVSVTVVADSGITADALSDAVFINGFTDHSLSYLKSFSAEAVFVFADKTYYVTEGLRDSFKPLDSSYSEHTEAPETELF